MGIDELRNHVIRIEAALRRGRKLTSDTQSYLLKARALLLEHDHGLGAVEARRCRATGALRVLYRPGTQADASEGWQVVCRDHSSVLDNETRRLGSLAMSDPDWCEECQRKVAGNA